MVLNNLVTRMKRMEFILIGLLAGCLFFAFAGFILNIILLANQISSQSNKNVPPPKEPCPPNIPSKDSSKMANQSEGFKAAARNLLAGLDLSVDPCQDFYTFSCNKFLQDNPVPKGKSRIAAYDKSQWMVNEQIRKAIEEGGEGEMSKTEKIINQFYKICKDPAAHGQDHSSEINEILMKYFGGMPAIIGPSWDIKNGGWQHFWRALGEMEANYQISYLLQSGVNVDYERHQRHAIYIDQPQLNLPREYFVKPEFLNHLDNYREMVISLVQTFAKKVGRGGQMKEDEIAKSVTEALRFEVQLAMAAYSNELSRNYRLQYNQYNLNQLKKEYPSIDWSAYFLGLFGSNIPADSASLVLVRPRFFAFLDTVLQGQQFGQSTLVNLVAIRTLLEFEEFLGPSNDDHSKQRLKAIPQFRRYPTVSRPMGGMKMGQEAKGAFFSSFAKEGADDFGQDCVDILTDRMPFGAGYVYVKGIAEREAVREDIELQTKLVIESFGEMMDSLDWIEPKAKEKAHEKVVNIRKNFGWPEELYGNFKNASVLDEYHREYEPMLKMKGNNNLFKALILLIKANQKTENFGKLAETPNRAYFYASPATVNAWYQPERNSITFPYAAFNPPYYRLDFPQAYNYAGQGGTGGHELSHGFDDEGVQFGPEGELSDCSWNNCGWMDSKSTLGFTQMAQCVVQQYSQKCCPLKSGSIRCANGATTQGENIADLAGQQAAYLAYRKYIEQHRGGKEEDPLPEMEQFTANQIFWITYGFSWCVNWNEKSLANRLLTNPHAPGQCRVNQVLQNIPQFGRDFNCPIGSPMRPVAQERCKVWTGN